MCGVSSHHEMDTPDGQTTFWDRKEKYSSSYHLREKEREEKKKNTTQAVLYSHEKLHKTNILVKPLNWLHLILREREVKYLYLWQMSDRLIQMPYFSWTYFCIDFEFIHANANIHQSSLLYEPGWSSLGWPPLLSAHWTSGTPELWSFYTFGQLTSVPRLPTVGGIWGWPCLRDWCFHYRHSDSTTECLRSEASSEPLEPRPPPAILSEHSYNHNDFLKKLKEW